MNIKRGQIYYVCLDPVFGREIGGFKMRPVIVLSINDINAKTRLVTVVPGTDAEHNKIPRPNIVKVEPDEYNNLKKATNFECHQIRAIEKGRFTQNAKGKIPRETLDQIVNAICYTLGMIV